MGALGIGIGTAWSGGAGKRLARALVRPAISWIEPVLESSFEALEHLFFDAFDVSELAPPSNITVFRRALSLYDKLFHQAQLVRVFFPEILFANFSSLFLPVLSPQTHRRFKLTVVNDLPRRFAALQRASILSPPTSFKSVACHCPPLERTARVRLARFIVELVQGAKDRHFSGCSPAG
jgi:hypothetical protein